MADVLRESGVNSGSFYHYFRSKEGLLLAVLQWYEGALYPILLKPIYEQTADPIARIFALLAKYRELIVQTNCTYGCPIGRLALEIAPERQKVHELLARNFEAWTRAVQKCLEDAGTRLPADLDRKRLARFVLTVMEGGVMQSRSYRSVEPFDDSVSQLREYFDRLLQSNIQSSKDLNRTQSSPGTEEES